MIKVVGCFPWRYFSPSRWRFVLRNVFMAIRMPDLPHINEHVVELGPFRRKDLRGVKHLYASCNRGGGLSFERQLVLWLVGGGLCLTVKNPSGGLVGVSIFYFNDKDRRDGTVHEGFIGLTSEYQSKGLGTRMRRVALEHFKSGGLKGVSSRVSLSNVRSLKGNLNIGYVPVEKYYDNVLAEERYYMVCWFQ